MKQVIKLLVVFSAAPFAFIFGNEADEFPLTELAVFLAAFAGILLVQSTAILALNWLLGRFGLGERKIHVARLLAAFFVACNAYSMAFMTYDATVVLQAALSLAAGIVAIVIFYVRRFQPFTLFVLSAYFVMSLGLYAYTRIAMEAREYASETTLQVNSRRNVYLIGNESLHSPKAFREIYGLRELPHVDFLRQSGFRVLDQSYSADVQTLESFSRMFEFNREIDHRDVVHRIVFRSNNSTLKAFSAGGYNSQILYRYAYFGVDPDLMDYSYPNSAYFHCGFVPAGFFYGLCVHPMRIRINRYIFGTPYVFDLSRLEDRIRIASRSPEPWLTVYHHPFPFHTRMAHRYSDEEDVERFRGRVNREMPRILQAGMQRIVQTILREDPEAVIILFGDHGTGLTRNAELDDPDDPFTPAQVLEDRFGVMIAVYPRDFCTNRIFEGSTTTALIESVVRCLNSDDSPTAQERARSRTFFWEDESRDVAQYTDLPDNSAGSPSASQPSPH